MDEMFGESNFLNEIIWKRQSAHSDTKQGSAHYGEWKADLEDEYRDPKSGWEYKGVSPYRGRFWGYSKANMIEFSKEGRLAYTREGMPQYKRYKDEMPG